MNTNRMRPRFQSHAAKKRGRRQNDATVTIDDVLNKLKIEDREKAGGEKKEAADVIAYLNDLCVSIANIDGSFDYSNFVLLCKRVMYYVFSCNSSVRAVTYRILRKSLSSSDQLTLLLNLHFDLFLIRSVDLDDNTLEERIEALKLGSLMVHFYNGSKETMQEHYQQDSLFPRCFIYAVAAIAFTQLSSNTYTASRTKEDELAFSCFALLAEFSVIEPDLVLETTGTSWIVEALTDPTLSLRLTAFVCQILCYWLDFPRLRSRAKLHLVLEQIFAPIAEIGFFERADGEEMQSARADTIEVLSHVFVKIMSTWSGLLACVATDEKRCTIVTSPIRFFEYLGLNHEPSASVQKVSDMIIHCFCELLNLPYGGQQFLSWEEALQFYATMHYPDSYKSSIRDQFVLAEHEVILKLEKRRSISNDLLKCFHALITYFLIINGALKSLSALIRTNPDDPIGIKATLLMSDLLAGATFLPNEWKLKVLSIPALVQSAIETVSASAPEIREDPNAIIDYTYYNARYAPLILNRLKELNEIAVRRTLRTLPITSLELFVQSFAQIAPEKDMVSKNATELEMMSEGALATLFDEVVDSQDYFRWSTISIILGIFEKQQDMLTKYPDKSLDFFKQIVKHLTPSEGEFLEYVFDKNHFVVACGSRFFRVLLSASAVDIQYREMASDYVQDFAKNLSPEVVYNGILSPKNLSNTGALYYFAYIGAISAHKLGRELIEGSHLPQLFLELITSNSPEYLKLIVSCLDYSSESSFARHILRTALTAANEAGRKWATRFLGILASHYVEDFGEWGMKMLLGQLADPSPKVVRHAIRVIDRWIPQYPKCLPHIGGLIGTNVFGDAEVLLRAQLHSNETYVKKHFRESITFLDYWKKTFNGRYVEIIDEDMNVALVDVKRSLCGYFARVSNDRSEKYGVPMPVHLYGMLAKHSLGRELLQKSREAERLLKILRDTQLEGGANTVRDVKGALYALGHLVAAMDYSLFSFECLPVICRYAESCPLLSVRGVAIWVINIIGSAKQGSRLLATLGWESTRKDAGCILAENEDIFLKSSQNGVPKIRCIDELQVCESDSESNVPTADPKVSDSGDDKRLSTSPPSQVSKVRTWTVDSSIISGQGSVPFDELDTCDLLSSGRRTSLIKEYSDDGLCWKSGFTDPRTAEKNGCTELRTKFGLCPIPATSSLSVTRSLGEPITYNFMSDEEFISYRKFRKLFYTSRESNGEETLPIRISSAVHTRERSITLPSHPDLLCKNIFLKVDEDFSVARKDTKQKSTSAKGLQHSKKRCFYCSWNKDYFGFERQGQENVCERDRLEVLSLVGFLGSVKMTCEKKLLSKFSICPNIFLSSCLYVDAVELLSQYRYPSEMRKLVHELFAETFEQFSAQLII